MERVFRGCLVGTLPSPEAGKNNPQVLKSGNMVIGCH